MTIKLKREKCATCIFRPGNPMFLRAGRVADMVRSCEANDGYIICHETLDETREDDSTRPMTENEAACRGYVDAGHWPQLLQVAERLGFLEEVS